MTAPGYRGKPINLDDVRKNQIVLTDLKEDLSESVFEQQFRLAAESIQKIIMENESYSRYQSTSCRHCKKTNCASCRHRDERGCADDSPQRFNRSEWHTAVPFIGERGTGKTSAMTSVLEYLRCYLGNPMNAAAFSLGSEKRCSGFAYFVLLGAFVNIQKRRSRLGKGGRRFRSRFKKSRRRHGTPRPQGVRNA